MRASVEVVFVPVADVDRAKEFYSGRLKFPVDFDMTLADGVRFVQLTPEGSGCSLAFGIGIPEMTQMAPGALNAGMLVVEDVAQAREELLAAGVEASDVDQQAWGGFVTFADPDGNRWRLQELPKRGDPGPST